MNTSSSSYSTLSKLVAITLVTLCLFEIANAAAPVPSNTPLQNIDRALSNVVLTLSAEFPTADTASYGVTGYSPTYIAASTYYGYFDPTKCYSYNTTTTYFSQTTCTATTPKGNFLNWASMTNIDQFRQTMTGGSRFIDTQTLTVLQRSFMDTLPGNITDTGVNSSNINAPNRVATTVDAGNLGAGASAQSGQYIYKIAGMGNKILVQSGNTVTFMGGTTNATKLAQMANQDCATLKATYKTGNSNNDPPWTCYHVRVKVCESAANHETYCTQYGSNYKPEGLMQTYNQNMRFAAFGYQADYSKVPDQQGGVLRARMKSVGPTLADPINISSPNAGGEWDAATGIFITNPDTADAAASSTLSGITIDNSGVMNYLNKFGNAANSSTGYAYKYYDPMAELYYDSLRYLRGIPASSQSLTNADSSHPQVFDGFPIINFQGLGTAHDPVTSACQQNFIIALGDKNNQSCDTRVPGGAACSGGSLPSGDSTNFATPANTVLALSGPGSSPANTADAQYSGSKWMAGLAYWAHTNDIRPDRAAQRRSGKIQDVTTFMVDVMEDGNYGGAVKTQLWMTAKYGGFDKTMTDQTSNATRNNPNTFKTSSTVRSWDKDGAGVPDNWYQGSDPLALKTGLTNVFQSIVTATSLGEGAAPATSGVSLSTAKKIYYASYELTNGGIGSVKACDFSATIIDCAKTPNWDAAAWLDPTATSNGYSTYQNNLTRQIITRSGGAGKIFSYANLTTAEKGLMDINPITKATDTPSLQGANRVDYIRGDSSREINKAGGIFRTRAKTKLGDIVGSGTVYVGAPNALYSGSKFPGYADFITSKANRTPVNYVGANDGMLHAIDAASGKELFAYVPNYFLKADATTTAAKISSLTMPNYQHQFYVDATPMVGDVKVGTVPAWKTLLVGGYGAGGRGFYALDVTNPTLFTTAMNAESNAAAISKWEFSDADDSDVGYTFNQPALSPASGQALQFALIPDGSGGSQWAVIVGNGFGSSSGKAVLYFLNPETGAQLYKVEVEASLGDNGLATPFPASTSGDGIIDTVWAGDLKGNLWRIRWNSATNAWTSSAAFTGSASKPITSAPAATSHPTVAGAWGVVFGTGKYFERSDYNTTTQQTLYGIADAFSSTPITIADLVQQTVSSPTVENAAGDFYRTQSSNAVNFATKKGWYFNMATTNGERSTVNPIIPADTGVALISSFTPASACLPATGYVNVVDAYTGGKVVDTSTGSAVDVPSWGGTGMGVPYFSTVVSSGSQAVVKAGFTRDGDVTNNPKGEMGVNKLFISGARFSWRQIR